MYGFTKLGPVLSLIMLVITAVFSYITSTYVIEAISVSSALRSKERIGTLFPQECYKSEETMVKANSVDAPYKKSPYYIR